MLTTPHLPPATDEPAPLRTTKELARRLGVKVETARGYARDGVIRSVKVGKGFRFRDSWIEEFIDARGPARRPRWS